MDHLDATIDLAIDAAEEPILPAYDVESSGMDCFPPFIEIWVHYGQSSA